MFCATALDPIALTQVCFLFIEGLEIHPANHAKAAKRIVII